MKTVFYKINKAFIFFYFFKICCVYGSPILLDEIISTIDYDIILNSDLSNIRKLANLDLKENDFNLLNLRNFKKNFIDFLIIDKINTTIINGTNLDLDENYLDLTLKNIATDNDITLKELFDYLFNHDIKYSYYRNKIKNDILINNIFKNLNYEKLEISNQDIQCYENSIYDNFMIDISYINISLNCDLYKNMEKVKTIFSFLKKHQISSFKYKILENYLNKIIKGTKIFHLGLKNFDNIPTLFKIYLLKSKNKNIVGPIYFNNNTYIIIVNKALKKKDKIFCEVCFDKLSFCAYNENLNFLKNIKKINHIILNNKFNFDKVVSDTSKIRDLCVKQFNKSKFLGFNDLDNNLYKIISDLNVNEVSTLFYLHDKWNLIRLLSIDCKDKKEFIKKDITKLILKQKLIELYEIWLLNHIHNYYIKINKNAIG